MEYKKQNEHEANNAVKKLVLAVCISILFVGAELFGGWISGSIAVFSDAAHLGSDIFGFIVSMVALKLS